MDNIILIGASGHAKSCIDVIEQHGQYKIAGLIERASATPQYSGKYPIIGADDDLQMLRKRYDHALIAVGQIKTPDIRKNLFQILKLAEYVLPIITSPVSYVSMQSDIGEGTIVMHGAIINAGAKIGQNCIINTRSLIEHDANIGSHCHIATGAILNGGVQVGEGSFVGSGVVIKQGVAIGRDCVIGAGCIIKKDLSDFEMVK